MAMFAIANPGLGVGLLDTAKLPPASFVIVVLFGLDPHKHCPELAR
jgi:hypothetical protein